MDEPMKKNERIHEIIHGTLLSLPVYKTMDIITANDVIHITSTLKEVTKTGKVDTLNTIVSKTGTHCLKDLFYLILGEEYTIPADNVWKHDKIQLLMRYFHPIGYKNVSYKMPHDKYTQMMCCDKITDEKEEINTYNDFECMVLQDAKTFYTKVHGLQFFFRNEASHKMYIIYGIIDDLLTECIHNTYLNERRETMATLAHSNPILLNFLDSLSIKQFLIFGNTDFLKREATVLHDVNIVKKNKLEKVIKKTVNMNLFSLRNFMISLLLYETNDPLENPHYIKYISYLLYDLVLINNREIINGDNRAYDELYDSFPWKIKMALKDSIHDSICFTDEMNKKYDTKSLSLEQQVYLFQAPESVKEKAMAKLKEIKNKGEENSKAKQYIEGLLKIPFGIMREEPILQIVKRVNTKFNQFTQHPLLYNHSLPIEKKSQYSLSEMTQGCFNIKKFIMESVQHTDKMSRLKTHQIHSLFNTLNVKCKRGKKSTMLQELHSIMDNHPDVQLQVYDALEETHVRALMREIDSTLNEIDNIDGLMTSIMEKLDLSVYGHSHAKNQILKVFGQWMTGKQKGYCFGFEGSPGIGKTSLAKKGLTQCLIDVDGTPRPFHFIALGGSANGSTLEGHGYTYQNSVWGRIADILMESKCMNPIIYIDELDKVSKTEHGREIIGILTHLIDSTQNEGFQDKYFMGIELDVSNVLFVFSYNNPEDIDPILLDRIHRIHFENLLLHEKIEIVKQFVLPELNDKMGWDSSHETIVLSDCMIEYIVKTYTNEPGIRKLKELLFDLVGEINIELLKRTVDIPVIIDETLLKDRFLKKYRKNREKKIHSECHIGYIHGLYANALGQGGILPIQCSFFPSTTFMELKLTGLIGNVMQESMNVARNVAWNWTPDTKKREFVEKSALTKNQGIHIHCPEGGIKKDGPSGGCCITVALFSLFNSKPIRNDVAITGEIDLHGNITAIGGLEYKILGGIESGIVHFLFPLENEEDYLDILEKYAEQSANSWKNVKFTMVSHIRDVLSMESLFHSI
jgi:ATP-dependent Lon protease